MEQPRPRKRKNHVPASRRPEIMVYADLHGTAAAAEVYQVSTSTINSWRAGRRFKASGTSGEITLSYKGVSFKSTDPNAIAALARELTR